MIEHAQTEPTTHRAMGRGVPYKLSECGAKEAEKRTARGPDKSAKIKLLPELVSRRKMLTRRPLDNGGFNGLGALLQARIS